MIFTPRWRGVAIALFLVVATCLPAIASTPYGADASGDLTGTYVADHPAPPQVWAGKTWDGNRDRGLKISWNIQQGDFAGKDWSYTYTVTSAKTSNQDLNKALEWFVLEVTPGATNDEFIFEDNDGFYSYGVTSFTNVSYFGESPVSFEGLMWSASSSQNKKQLDITFYTDRAPVYGYYYLANYGGTKNNKNVAKWEPDYLIARPNGLPTSDNGVVPEPGSMMLWGLGLMIAGWVRFRRRRAVA